MADHSRYSDDHPLIGAEQSPMNSYASPQRTPPLSATFPGLSSPRPPDLVPILNPTTNANSNSMPKLPGSKSTTPLSKGQVTTPNMISVKLSPMGKMSPSTIVPNINTNVVPSTVSAVNTGNSNNNASNNPNNVSVGSDPTTGPSSAGGTTSSSVIVNLPLDDPKFAECLNLSMASFRGGRRNSINDLSVYSAGGPVGKGSGGTLPAVAKIRENPFSLQSLQSAVNIYNPQPGNDATNTGDTRVSFGRTLPTQVPAIPSSIAAALPSPATGALGGRGGFPEWGEGGKKEFGIPRSQSESALTSRRRTLPLVTDFTTRMHALRERRQFMVLLCAALHKFGSPTHVTETMCFAASETLGVTATFTVFPTRVMISFTGSAALLGAEPADTRQILLEPCMDLGKLGQADDFGLQVIEGKLNFEEAKEKLKTMVLTPGGYCAPIELATHVLASWSVGMVLFRVSWLEGMFCCIGGLIVGSCSRYLDRISTALGRVLNFLAPAMVSFIMTYSSRALPHFSLCPLTMILASVVWLLPGLGLTIAVSELFAKQYISGSCHLFSCVLATVQMGYGITFGATVAQMPPISDSAEEYAASLIANFTAANSTATAATKVQTVLCFHDPGGAWYLGGAPIYLYPFLLSCTIVGFCVLCLASKSQCPYIAVACISAYLSSLALSGRVQNEVAVFISAFVLGVVGEVYGFLGHHSVVLVLPAVCFLVPGSMGVKGVATMMMTQDVVSGMSVLMHTLLVCVTITMGLLTAKGLSPPSRRHAGRRYALPL